jgi:hypothetical protein
MPIWGNGQEINITTTTEGEEVEEAEGEEEN